MLSCTAQAHRAERERARLARGLRDSERRSSAPTKLRTTLASAVREFNVRREASSAATLGDGSRRHGAADTKSAVKAKASEEKLNKKANGERNEGECEEPVLLSIGGGISLSELTEREGELFGRLQAETLEMRQRAQAAEKVEKNSRAEAERWAVTADAELEAALAEAKELKAEAEAGEVRVLLGDALPRRIRLLPNFP